MTNDRDLSIEDIEEGNRAAAAVSAIARTLAPVRGHVEWMCDAALRGCRDHDERDRVEDVREVFRARFNGHDARLRPADLCFVLARFLEVDGREGGDQRSDALAAQLDQIATGDPLTF